MAIKAKEQVTLIDITDAYSVVLTSESYIFMGNTSGAPVNSSCSTQVVAYQGNAPVQKVTVSSVSCPTGITATISGNGGISPTITFKTTAIITGSCEATITVKVDDVTFNKKFSFAVSKTGATGTSVSKTIRYYKLQDSSAAAPAKPTSNPPSGWTTTEPTYASGKSLYFVDCTIYSTGSIAFSDVSKSSSYTAANDLKDQYDEFKMNYRFDSTGQYIGKGNSNAVVHITNEKMEILVSNEPLTVVNTKGLISDQATVNTIRIGDYFISVYQDGQLHIS